MLSGLNSVDTDWSAYNFIIDPKRLSNPIISLLIGDEPGPLGNVCCLQCWFVILNPVDVRGGQSACDNKSYVVGRVHVTINPIDIRGRPSACDDIIDVTRHK